MISVLDNQIEHLKNSGIDTIEYYTKNLEDPVNSKIIPYYEVIKVSTKKKELTLSIKDIPSPTDERMDELKDIKIKVLNSVQKLFKKDRVLILSNINERTITHKLAEYLQDDFNDFNVDCEYNRSFDQIKKLEVPKDLLKLKVASNVKWDDTEAKTIYPDIIVHERKTNSNNILVIEVKKWNNQSSENSDKIKLKSFTRKPFNYKFGVFLKILNENEIRLTFYKDGDQIGNPIQDWMD